MAKSKRTRKRTSAKQTASKNVSPLSEAKVAKDVSPSKRVANLKKAWWLPCPKKLLLIRPKIPGDGYTELGSFLWAEDVKTKANAEGWDVTDLDANNATRANIENALNNVKPHLVIHYDHGSSLTLWGQKGNALEAGLDDSNIALASGKMVSTVSCNSASGLGPSSITKGVISYIGYTQPHGFYSSVAAEFGQASNAANFVLLEGGTAQQAFDAGWTAYTNLYNYLMSLTPPKLAAAAMALHDRDCMALIGSARSTAPPPCSCPFALPLHCWWGLPDRRICYLGLPGWCLGIPLEVCKYGNPAKVLCKYGNPMIACKYGNPIIPCSEGLPDVPICWPGLPHVPECPQGLPNWQRSLPHELHCRPGMPDRRICPYGGPVTPCEHGNMDIQPLCTKGLPIEDLCALGLPKSPPVCGKGPDGCHAGPPLVLQDVIKDFPEDIVIVDRAKIPPSMRKAFDNMISRMQREGR
jgi:hypothetical protein